jgi:tRNA(Ile)-lysidine synthase
VIPAFLEDPARAGDLPRWVLDYAREQEMFVPGERVLAAVSGGPDSVALLHLLARFSSELRLSLGVAHFDHGLRAESREDAAFVAELAGRLSLPCHLGRGEVRDLARREKISLQMAGRRLRLTFFRDICRTKGYSKLALGHTADDQIELFWLRLFRGAALTGLKGMEAATAAGLLRPLLAVGKDVLLAWLAQESLAFRTDSSNLSRAYLRNRVRLDLLPQMIRDYQPRLKQTVWRTMALLREEDQSLAREAARAWAATGREVAPGLVALRLPRLLALDRGQQKRLLQTAAGQIAAHLTLTAAQVVSLLDLARGARSGGVLSLGRDLQAARAGGELHFLEPLPKPLAGATLIPREEAEPESPPGWRWRLRPRPAGAPKKFCPAPHTAVLDLERLPFPLEARGCRPGDRFWPQGAPGLKKLQDFLVDAKVPRWLRPHLPLLAAGDHILWVPGLRAADPVKITPETRRLLEVEIHPTTPVTRRIWEILLAWRV